MKRLESSIESAFVRWCKVRRILCLKLVPFGFSGFPDRTVITLDGRIVFIEFKRSGGKLSPGQVKWQRVLTEYRQRVVVAYSVEDAIAEVER